MNDQIISIEGPEQELVDPNTPDAGLPPAVGVRSWCVFRACKDRPDLSDGMGWTYHHHVDMACWRGKLYVGWNACEKDEDTWPSREWYATSDDGRTWTKPLEMFPQGVSTPLRMYFFRAPNDRMLMIAGLRVDTSDTNEDTKWGLVVREIKADHSLGDVYTLQPAGRDASKYPPIFEQSSDSGFIEACKMLLADKPYLEQQDRGKLLGNRRMKWHDASAWPAGAVPGDDEKWVAGKAYSFFERPDGALIGVSKMGWTTISRDGGETWAQPLVPPTLVTGKAKVWVQRTYDGKYALVYNPSRRARYPLIVVSGDDGIHFRDMRLVQGELPRQRYKGKFRSVGPQYTRGISHWASDGSRKDNCIWLVYSMSKEDIWVSRVPLPVTPEATGQTHSPWSSSCPRWNDVRINDDVLSLTSCDPYDAVTATRSFEPADSIRARFQLQYSQSRRGQLQIGIHRQFGSAAAVAIILDDSGEILARYARHIEKIGSVPANGQISVEMSADLKRHGLSVTLNGATHTFAGSTIEGSGMLNRIHFRAGAAISGQFPEDVPRGSDIPQEPTVYQISELTLSR